MKTTYRLRNFRAFQDTGTLNVAPVTVLCGENSSGKSSILKSLLLVKQSSTERRARIIKNSIVSPLLFNGELTRLGSWTDVVNKKDRDRPITFEWTASGNRSEIVNPIGPRGIRQRTRSPESKFDFCLSVEFRSVGQVSEELSTRLTRAFLKHDATEISITRSEANQKFHTFSINSIASLTGSSARFVQNMSYFDMREVARLVRTMGQRATLGEVTIESDGPFITNIRPVFNESWTPFLNSILNHLLQSRVGIRGPKPKWVTDFETAVRQYRLKASAQDGLSDVETTRLAALRQFVTSILIEAVAAFDECKSALAPFWQRVRYIGPLRHQPQRFYQFDDTGGIDLGVSGEFTIQVLALESGNVLRGRGINVDNEGLLHIGEPTMDSLLSRTNYWLNKMDLPDVSPLTVRQSLYELNVGELEVALPDVGFGVSQVLPIIVECLRAERGDLVILEQPEIHLHPRIQAILGDFFLARAMDGVTFLVESHSEYMIKRLCRRVAEGNISSINDLINITFVSQDEGGTAHCDHVQLNSYGEIENWPSGFFDTREDLYWTQASLRRRAAEARAKRSEGRAAGRADGEQQ